MPLTSGTKLGPYEIQSPLGAGGMGEVYRARDTRLERIVAIKILHAHLSENPDTKQRFEREARAISSLNHPYICQLYDIGSQDGTDFLVMEFLEGETLADRLRKGPMPLGDVLKVGINVAEALEVAHRAGIVHRDLKPGNIMLTKSGARLMDFGLAKSQSAIVGTNSSSGSNPALHTSSMATINVSALTSPASPLTQKGSIVGTFQYMAPEVLQGADADARSDIFSFGCVLYEMATGKRPFDAKSQVGVLAAILEKDPEPISISQPSAPPALDRLIRNCLAKDPDQRWQSAHDLKVQLQTISEIGAQTGSQIGIPALVATRRINKRILIAAAILGWTAALAAVAAAFYFQSHGSSNNFPVRAEIDLPPAKDIRIGGGGAASISPDGKKLAFALASSNDYKLWVRDLESGKTVEVPGTDDGRFPFWSPDSNMLGFFANGKLRTVPAAGGPVQTICPAPAGRGGSWNQFGVILFTPNIREGLYQVPEAGGTPALVTSIKAEKFTNRNPMFLPDGKHFLFVERTREDQPGDLFAGSLTQGRLNMVVANASNVSFTQGYILYLRDRNLVAQRFDPASLTVRGNPIPIAENVEYWRAKDLGNFSASPGGTLVYRTDAGTKTTFAWLKLPGSQLEEFGEKETMLGVVGATILSTNGKRIAFLKREPASPDPELWVYDIDHKTFSRLNSEAQQFVYSAFSPDSTRIAMTKRGIGNLTSDYSIRSLLTGAVEKLDIRIPSATGIMSWTPDGKYLIIVAQDPKTQEDLWAQPVDGGKAIPLLTSSFSEPNGEVSPNGKWMAYSSNESGRYELYVTDFPGVHSKLQISNDGVGWARWARDGKRLYFTQGKVLYAATMANPGNLEFGNIETVATMENTVPIDFAPDGRLLVQKEENGGRSTPLQLVLNFPASLPK